MIWRGVEMGGHERCEEIRDFEGWGAGYGTENK